MTKQEFLDELKYQLSGLASFDSRHLLKHYEQRIDENIESGMSEEEAVSSLGTVMQVANRAILKCSLKNIKEHRKNHRKHRSVGQWFIFILTSPLWISVQLAIALLVAAVFLLVWLLVAFAFCLTAAMALGSLIGTFISILTFVNASRTVAVGFEGACIIAFGLSVLLFVGSLALAKSAKQLYKKMRGGYKILLARSGRTR